MPTLKTNVENNQLVVNPVPKPLINIPEGKPHTINVTGIEVSNDKQIAANLATIKKAVVIKANGILLVHYKKTLAVNNRPTSKPIDSAKKKDQDSDFEKLIDTDTTRNPSVKLDSKSNTLDFSDNVEVAVEEVDLEPGGAPLVLTQTDETKPADEIPELSHDMLEPGTKPVLQVENPLPVSQLKYEVPPEILKTMPKLKQTAEGRVTTFGVEKFAKFTDHWIHRYSHIKVQRQGEKLFLIGGTLRPEFKPATENSLSINTNTVIGYEQLVVNGVKQTDNKGQPIPDTTKPVKLQPLNYNANQPQLFKK